MIVAPLEDRRLMGIGLILIAFLVFTGIDTCAKWLVLAGLPPWQVVFIRYAVHLVMATALILPASGGAVLRSVSPGSEVVRGVFLLASTMLNFNAVRYLPLTLTSAIMFTIPLWICAFSIPLLGEKVGPRRWAAIVVGLGGVLIIARPWSAEAHWAVVLSIAAAISAALYTVMTRKLAGRDSTATQQFYAAAIATTLIAPMALIDWHWPERPVDWIAFGLIGLFGWGGHQLLTIAHRFAPASVLAPFGYFQIIYMTASSWLIFATPPEVWVLAGAAVVLASGLYIWIRERHLAEN